MVVVYQARGGKVKAPVDNLQNTLNKKYYSNNVNKVIKNISNYSIPGNLADSLVEEALGLMDNHKFKPYLYKTLFMIGQDKFREAMKAARLANARCPACYFAKTLKIMRDNRVQNHT